MRRVFHTLVGVSILIFSTAIINASQQSRSEMQLLKAREKEARKSLKIREGYQKQSMRGQNIPRAVRAQSKHEMQRQARALREQQRNERQDLKDKLRLIR